MSRVLWIFGPRHFKLHFKKINVIKEQNRITYR